MKHEAPYWLTDSEPETPQSEEYPAPWIDTDVVGSRLPRVDAYERVSGSAVYPHDVALPEMLHGAILRCPHANARVVRIDTSKAEKMPGVRAVLTPQSAGADIAWYESRGTVYGRLLDTHCRHEGDEVAAVAAESPHQAADALLEAQHCLRQLHIAEGVAPLLARRIQPGFQQRIVGGGAQGGVSQRQADHVD